MALSFPFFRIYKSRKHSGRFCGCGELDTQEIRRYGRMEPSIYDKEKKLKTLTDTNDKFFCCCCGKYDTCFSAAREEWVGRVVVWTEEEEERGQNHREAFFFFFFSVGGTNFFTHIIHALYSERAWIHRGA